VGVSSHHHLLHGRHSIYWGRGKATRAGIAQTARVFALQKGWSEDNFPNRAIGEEGRPKEKGTGRGGGRFASASPGLFPPPEPELGGAISKTSRGKGRSYLGGKPNRFFAMTKKGVGQGFSDTTYHKCLSRKTKGEIAWGKASEVDKIMEEVRFSSKKDPNGISQAVLNKTQRRLVTQF